MYIAEQLQVVAKEQYGSRKYKAATEQCLNKRLTFDLARTSIETPSRDVCVQTTRDRATTGMSILWQVFACDGWAWKNHR
jgi:hypothetical protein